jgi:hypothetical protein
MAMMRLLDGFPPDVVAVATTGRLTRADYETVLIPRLEAAAASHRKLRCYYQLDEPFAGMDAGAAWDDARVGIEYWTRWERVAVVTDVAWIAHLLDALRFLMPGRVRAFPTAQADDARAWLTER